MFTAALFTTAKTWRQPKCLSMDEWIEMWCTHTMEYYSAMKKDEIISSAATYMELEIIILSEVSQTEKDKYHMVSLPRGNSNTTQISITMKQKRTHRHRTDSRWSRGRVGVGGMGWEAGVSRRKLLHTGRINNEVLPCSTGSSSQHPGINHNGREHEKE